MNNKKHKFNIIDLVIIFAVVLFGMLLVKNFIFDAQKESRGEKVNLQYVIETEMLSEALADNVKVGDAVYDYASGRKIGQVTACDVRNATHTGMSESGAQVVSDVVGYRCLYITVEGEALHKADGYTVDSVAVSVGREYSLMLPDLYCKGSCISAEITD